MDLCFIKCGALQKTVHTVPAILTSCALLQSMSLLDSQQIVLEILP